MQTITMNDGNKIPQLGYGVFQMSSDEAAGHLLGRAVAEQADESILADDVVDLGKLNPVTFDPALRAYRTLGPVVGKTRSGGEWLSGRRLRPADTHRAGGPLAPVYN